MAKFRLIRSVTLCAILVLSGSCAWSLALGPIDDIVQFRTPYSLAEKLHDGLVTVEYILQEALDDEASELNDLTRCLQTIETMIAQYDLMIGKSPINQVHRDMKDSLQHMIERINQMIDNLEGSRSLDRIQQQILSDHKQALDLLRERLS